jgi:hypothetical protein
MYTYIVGKKRRKVEIVEGENTIVIPSCWNKIWFIESENNIDTPRMNKYWEYWGRKWVVLQSKGNFKALFNSRTQSPNLELSIYFSYWQRNWRCHRYDISAMTESLKISLRLKNNPFSTSIIPILIHSRCDNIVFTLDKPYFVSTAWYDNSIFTLDNLYFSSFFTDNVRIHVLYLKMGCFSVEGKF